jgi:hypothetical protein
MTKSKRAEAINLEDWVRANQKRKCLICRTEGASDLVESVLTASKKLGLTVPQSKLCDLLRERGVLETTSHTMRDHIRRCRGKAR